MVKVQQSGLTKISYVFVMSSARGSGTDLTVTLAGYGNLHATEVYDSDTQYDPANSTAGAVIPLNASGQFVVHLGYHGDDYEVQAFKVQ